MAVVLVLDQPVIFVRYCYRRTGQATRKTSRSLYNLSNQYISYAHSEATFIWQIGGKDAKSEEFIHVDHQ